MLLRMYLRWAERRGFDVELDEVLAGHRGRASRRPRSSIKGRYAYGLLAERAGRAPPGPHLAVRRQRRRQTAFAALDVVPALDEADGDSRSTRRTCASTPTAPRAPAASTST